MAAMGLPSVNILAVDGHFLGCGDADLDLITFDLQNGDLDIVVDDDCFDRCVLYRRIS